MKRLLIFIGLFIALFANAQDDLRADYVIANVQLEVRDSTLLELIAEHGGGSNITASNGITLVSTNFKLGGTLSENTTIEGAGYNFVVNEAGLLTLNSTSDIELEADDDLILNIGGTEWVFDGDYFVSENSDTLMTNDLVDAKILEAIPYAPLNFDYTFSSTTTDSRPGVGYFRFNSSTYSSVTQIYIDYYDIESTNKSDFLTAADTGSYMFISDGTNYANYQLTGGIVTGSSYYKFGVSYLSNSGVLSGSCDMVFDISGSSSGSGGGISDAPSDGDVYARKDAMWQKIDTTVAVGTEGAAQFAGADGELVADEYVLSTDSSLRVLKALDVEDTITANKLIANEVEVSGAVIANSVVANGSTLRPFTTTNSSIFNLSFTSPTLSLSFLSEKTDGAFYRGTFSPTNTTLLNYDGYFAVTKLFADDIEISSGTSSAVSLDYLELDTLSRSGIWQETSFVLNITSSNILNGDTLTIISDTDIGIQLLEFNITGGTTAYTCTDSAFVQTTLSSTWYSVGGLSENTFTGSYSEGIGADLSGIKYNTSDKTDYRLILPTTATSGNYTYELIGIIRKRL